MTASDAALLCVRLLVAGVFGTAALGKFADRSGVERALVEFGVGEGAARTGAVLLPVAELLIAMALVPATLARWGTAGALMLLIVFTVGVVANMSRGRRPDCHCFGQLHSRPIGWRTVGRNAALSGLAVVALAAPSPSVGLVGAELGALSAGQLAALALATLLVGLCTIQTWLLLNVMRQNGRLLLRLDVVESSLQANGLLAVEEPGLPVGTGAPGFTLPDLSGRTMNLETLTAEGQPVVLIFTDPDCAGCETLLPDIARWQRDRAVTMAVISRGDIAANKDAVVTFGLQSVLLQTDWEVSAAYDSMATPSAVVIDRAGRIAAPAAAGAEGVRDLVARATAGILLEQNGRPHRNGQAHHHPATGLPVGAPVPRLSFGDLDGRTVDLAALEGRETLLLFWHPDCGFCQKMLPELKVWEKRRPRVDLLIVSSGSVETNRAMGLSSTIVLDQRGEATEAFGAKGAPMAVLVDAEGRVASELAAGAPAVLALARSRHIPVQLKGVRA